MADEHIRRSSLRYPGYDYAQAGAMFVTVCTQDRQPLFGAIQDSEVVLTPAGTQACERWRQIPDRFSDVIIDTFIIMPDHVHGILLTATDPAIDRPATPGEVIRWFKSALFADYTNGVRNCGWEPYDRQLWQRNYYDRIIRNDAELSRIQQYIDANPSRRQARIEEETRI